MGLSFLVNTCSLILLLLALLHSSAVSSSPPQEVSETLTDLVQAGLDDGLDAINYNSTQSLNQDDQV